MLWINFILFVMAFWYVFYSRVSLMLEFKQELTRKLGRKNKKLKRNKIYGRIEIQGELERTLWYVLIVDCPAQWLQPLSIYT